MVQGSGVHDLRVHDLRGSVSRVQGSGGRGGEISTILVVVARA